MFNIPIKKWWAWLIGLFIPVAFAAPIVFDSSNPRQITVQDKQIDCFYTDSDTNEKIKIWTDASHINGSRLRFHICIENTTSITQTGDLVVLFGDKEVKFTSLEEVVFDVPKQRIEYVFDKNDTVIDTNVINYTVDEYQKKEIKQTASRKVTQKETGFSHNRHAPITIGGKSWKYYKVTLDVPPLLKQGDSTGEFFIEFRGNEFGQVK